MQFRMVVLGVCGADGLEASVLGSRRLLRFAGDVAAEV